MGTSSSGINSFAQRFSGNYNRQLNALYGRDLEIADTAGLWGLGSIALTSAVSGFQSFTDALATDQISNALMQGAFTKGDILSKLSAAQLGERTAIRTGTLLSGMRMTGTISTVLTVGATGYSVGARGNALMRALFDSF